MGELELKDNELTGTDFLQWALRTVDGRKAYELGQEAGRQHYHLDRLVNLMGRGHEAARLWSEGEGEDSPTADGNYIINKAHTECAYAWGLVRGLRYAILLNEGETDRLDHIRIQKRFADARAKGLDEPVPLREEVYEHNGKVTRFVSY